MDTTRLVLLPPLKPTLHLWTYLETSESLVVEAARGLDNAADHHPQAARRCAPHNQRMQQPIPSASKLASGLAADPQH